MFHNVCVPHFAGADLSDYFNYGFNEDTWKAYCEKQKRLRMGLEVSTVGSVTSKISVSDCSPGLVVVLFSKHYTHLIFVCSSVGSTGEDRQ